MRAFLSAAVLAAASLALVAPASATIDLQHGIAGVEVGMSQKQVRAKHGSPRRIKRGRNAFGAYTIYVYAKLRLTVTFQGNRTVSSVVTTSRREQTTTGVGVGSTETDVKTSLLHVHCRTDAGRRHCFVGQLRPGKRVTDFTLRRGRVTSVTVGLVLD